MKRKAATPAEAVMEQSDRATRAEDPGLSVAREAAEAVPAESVHLKRNEKRMRPKKRRPTGGRAFITEPTHVSQMRSRCRSRRP